MTPNAATAWPSVQVVEQVPHALFVVVEEVPGQGEVLGVLEGSLLDAVRPEAEDPRMRIRQQDGRVRGDDELGPVLDQPVDQAQRGQLARRRQRGMSRTAGMWKG